MENKQIWGLIQDSYRELVPAYLPLFDRFCSENSLDRTAVGWLLAALTFEPDTISPARLQVRGPYPAAAWYLAQLSALAENGFLVEAAPGEFHLTKSGRSRILQLVQEVRSAMADADPLSLISSTRLSALLDALVQASLQTPPPPDRWSIELACKLMPGISPPLPYAEQAISCLNGYRDDAHLAAWQPDGISAPALETLTLLWRAAADSLEALMEQLKGRGHPAQVYSDALQELRERRLIAGPDTRPELTPAGETYRRKVEINTDRYFFSPWGALDPDEMHELAGLLTQLKEGLVSKRG